MSRALSHRLAKLEVRNAPHETGLVILAMDRWPANDDRPAWDRIRAEHPLGRIFLPSQAVSAEAWEKGTGR